MKYGLDINDNTLLRNITEKLRNEGYVVVSMSELEYYNKGDMLSKKVLLANQTKVDFYLRLNVSEGEKNKILLYGDRSFKTLKFYQELYNHSKIFNNISIEYIEGLNYYLIKNVKGSTSFLEISFIKEDLDYEKIEEYVTRCLLSLNKLVL